MRNPPITVLPFGCFGKSDSREHIHIVELRRKQISTENSNCSKVRRNIERWDRTTVERLLNGSTVSVRCRTENPTEQRWSRCRIGSRSCACRGTGKRQRHFRYWCTIRKYTITYTDYFFTKVYGSQRFTTVKSILPYCFCLITAVLSGIVIAVIDVQPWKA